MRWPALLSSLGAVSLLLLTGCTPPPAPTPTASAQSSVAATPSPTPTPTEEPVVEPTPAFDVTCDDVAAVMAQVSGEPSTPVAPTLSLVSSPSWYSGPAQHMFARAGGVACSAGDDTRNWEIAIAPGGQRLVEGARSRDGFDPDGIRCDGGYGSGACVFNVSDGDVLVSGKITGPDLTADDAGSVEAAVRGLAADAATTQGDVELGDSEIVGVPCTRFLTAEELSERLDAPAALIESFGGWGIPAEVYHVVNGSRICYYAAGPNEYDDAGYLMITTLPGGAWAFDRIEGAEPVVVTGADAAVSHVDATGNTVIDVRIGADWIRVTVYPPAGAVEAADLASDIVQSFAVGRPAPQ